MLFRSGQPKVHSAKQRLQELNPFVQIEIFQQALTSENALQICTSYDVIIDGTDNFQIRYLINDACVKHGVPWIYGAAVSSYGTTMTILPGQTPCLRCIFDEMPDAGSAPTCDTTGVIMSIISTVSATQVTECLKLLVGDRDDLVDFLHVHDGRDEAVADSLDAVLARRAAEHDGGLGGLDGEQSRQRGRVGCAARLWRRTRAAVFNHRGGPRRIPARPLRFSSRHSCGWRRRDDAQRNRNSR